MKNIEYCYHGWYIHLDYIERFVKTYPKESPDDKMTFVFTGKGDETRPTRLVPDELRKEYGDLARRMVIFLSRQAEDLSLNNPEFANTIRILEKHDRPKQEENIWWGISGLMTCAASAINRWNYKEMTTDPGLTQALSTSIPHKTVPSLIHLIEYVRAQLIQGTQSTTLKEWTESLNAPIPHEIESTIENYILPMTFHILDEFTKNEKRYRNEFKTRAEEIINFSKHLPLSGRFKWLHIYYNEDFPSEEKKINKWHAIKFGAEVFRAFAPYSSCGDSGFWIVSGKLVNLLSGNKIKEFLEILKADGFEKPVSMEEYSSVIKQYG